MEKIKLSDHFTISRILLFSLPSIGMEIVDSTYQVVDGFFISNYIGESAFGAENLIYPPLLIIMSLGLMFGSGASALLSKEMGEGHGERANRLMTMLTGILTGVGIVLSLAMFLLMPRVARWVGSSDEMLGNCIAYGRVLSLFMPFQMLSMAFHALLIAAERPGLGLAVTISNAVLNIILDWAFVVIFGWGLEGAAVATGLSWIISAAIPFVFFLRKNSELHFTKPVFDLKALAQTVYNGASEMVDAVAYAVVAVIFNLQLIRYFGDAGVEAYAVCEYVGGFFNAVFYGISMSIVPVVGYHLGQANKKELHSLWHRGMILMGSCDLVITMICIGFARHIASVFVGYNLELTALSTHALKLDSLYLLLNGVTIYAGSYFTGLNQGTASLVIALIKGIIGPLLFIWMLPVVFGPDAIWLATPGSEFIAAIAMCLFIVWWWLGAEDRHLGEKEE